MEIEDLLERIRDKELALELKVEGKCVLGLKVKEQNIDIDIKDLKGFRSLVEEFTK